MPREERWYGCRHLIKGKEGYVQVRKVLLGFDLRTSFLVE